MQHMMFDPQTGEMVKCSEPMQLELHVDEISTHLVHLDTAPGQPLSGLYFTTQNQGQTLHVQSQDTFSQLGPGDLLTWSWMTAPATEHWVTLKYLGEHRVRITMGSTSSSVALPAGRWQYGRVTTTLSEGLLTKPPSTAGTSTSPPGGSIRPPSSWVVEGLQLTPNVPRRLEARIQIQVKDGHDFCS